MGKSQYFKRGAGGKTYYVPYSGPRQLLPEIVADVAHAYSSVDDYTKYEAEYADGKYIFHELFGDGDTFGIMCRAETPDVAIVYYFTTAPVYRAGLPGYGDDEVETTLYEDGIQGKELVKINLQMTEALYKVEDLEGDYTRQHIHDVFYSMKNGAQINA